MEIKVVKTQAEYQAALGELERLIDLDPLPGTSDARDLELLTLVLEAYEAKAFPIDLPDPIDAIEFCMEQKGLGQKDLIPYMGSRSKVSEVLGRKRPLTLSMIRALHKGLNIPAEVLLGEPGATLEEGSEIEWEKFPLKEMIERGWVDATLADAHDRAEEVMRAFLRPIGGIKWSPVRLRRSYHMRAARHMNDYALEAWRARVMMAAMDQEIANFRPELINLPMMRDLAKLSRLERGPVLARDFLNGYGIAFVVEGHMQKTYLDGAAFLVAEDRPVISMTLRYNRLDNFWFVLMHELAHVWKHLKKESESFFDDIDLKNDLEPVEKEADRIAGEALIPRNEWDDSSAKHLQTAEAAIQLAEELRIHPAIVAGKIRYESRNYKKLNNLVGHGQVKKLFQGLDG